jgi:hypothetical protein
VLPIESESTKNRAEPCLIRFWTNVIGRPFSIKDEDLATTYSVILGFVETPNASAL